MGTGQIVMAILFTALALAHSMAGESGFIRPLLAADWSIDEVPRWAANRLLRGAWHLTSLAWVALAVIALDGSPLLTAAVVALASSAAMLVTLPGHPAWPAFLLAGLAGLHAEGALTGAVLAVGATIAVVIALALAAVHVYWLVGGRRGLDGVIPTTVDGEPTFELDLDRVSGRLATAAVVVALSVFAGLVGLAATTTDPSPLLTGLVLGGVAVLALRAIGDGRHVGFTKRHRDSRFGRLDDQWFTPLATVLAVAASAAVL